MSYRWYFLADGISIKNNKMSKSSVSKHSIALDASDRPIGRE